jgi:hypothetical protein
LKISDLTYVKHGLALVDILEGNEMIDPIEVEKHFISDTPRMGANGNPYIEKQYTVFKGSQRITAALQMGYTHIEGIVIND